MRRGRKRKERSEGANIRTGSFLVLKKELDTELKVRDFIFACRHIIYTRNCPFLVVDELMSFGAAGKRPSAGAESRSHAYITYMYAAAAADPLQGGRKTRNE